MISQSLRFGTGSQSDNQGSSQDVGFHHDLEAQSRQGGHDVGGTVPEERTKILNGT